MKWHTYLNRLSASWIVWVLACCLAATIASAAPGPSAESLFQQGNALYQQGKYQEALDVYTHLIAEEGFSGPLLYNLGNCYAQTGRIGLAILNYERALRLSPGNADIKGNLDLLRTQRGFFQEERPWTQRMVTLLTLDQWTLAAGLFLVGFTLINLAGLRLAARKNTQRWMSGCCLLCMVIAAVGIFFQYRQQDAAVVISSDARLLLSPFPSSDPVGAIQEGRVVYQTGRHGHFALVEDASGRTGWIETEAIVSIAPDTAPSAKLQQ